MPEIRTADIFDARLLGLRDRMGRAEILRRIDRLQHGNPGLSTVLSGLRALDLRRTVAVAGV